MLASKIRCHNNYHCVYLLYFFFFILFTTTRFFCSLLSSSFCLLIPFLFFICITLDKNERKLYNNVIKRWRKVDGKEEDMSAETKGNVCKHEMSKRLEFIVRYKIPEFRLYCFAILFSNSFLAVFCFYAFKLTWISSQTEENKRNTLTKSHQMLVF